MKDEAGKETRGSKDEAPRLPKLDDLVERARRLARPYRVKDGRDFRLKDVDPGDTGWLKAEDKPAGARKRSQTGIEVLAELQDMLYAQDRWAVLLIFQAMDAAGQGRRDQARDVRRQPAGLPGLLVQGAVAPRSSTTTTCGAA